MHQCTCVVYIPTCSLTTGTYHVWVNRSTLLIIYSRVPSQHEYTLHVYMYVIYNKYELICSQQLCVPQ